MTDAKKRSIMGAVAVAACVLVSLGLAIAKMYVGLRSNSLVIMLDGMNSFFDVATGVVTVVAFCLLLRPRSPRHPFGFGRGEYLSGFVVAAVTVVMGGVFFLRSVNRLAMPEPVYYRTSSMVIISVALAVKIGMTVAYAMVNRRVRSYALKALLLDSVLDVGATAASVLSFTLSLSTSYAVDAWMGIAVSVAVAVVGVKLVIDNARLLLGGGSVDKERTVVLDALRSVACIEEVRAVVLADYGYRNKVGHAEVVFVPGVSAAEAAECAADVAQALRQQGIELHVVPVL